MCFFVKLFVLHVSELIQEKIYCKGQLKIGNDL